MSTREGTELAVEMDPQLVEEAVLQAVEGLSPRMRARFRSERDAVYRCEDAERRETLFTELHGSWFARLGLGRRALRIIEEHPLIAGSTAGCRIIQARARKEEGADLHRLPAGFERKYPPGPLLVIRLRVSTLLQEAALEQLLTYELAHVTDMLDPEFGYDPNPDLEVDPPLQSLIKGRYRLLWDIRIAGRISRAGRPSASVEEELRCEFAAAFPMLGTRADTLFRTFFDPPQPTHGEILAFALDPSTRCQATVSPAGTA